MFTGFITAALLMMPVQSERVSPFECKNAKAETLADLQRQCSEAHMILKWYTFGPCEEAGDDGGYVHYYAISAQGECVSDLGN